MLTQKHSTLPGFYEFVETDISCWKMLLIVCLFFFDSLHLDANWPQQMRQPGIETNPQNRNLVSRQIWSWFLWPVEKATQRIEFELWKIKSLPPKWF